MYFIWQLINILAIIALIIYAIKFIYNFKKHKVKSISYLAVTLGLLIVSNLMKEKSPNQVFVLNTISETTNGTTKFSNKTVSLIDALTFDINVQIISLVNDAEIIPTKAISVIEGFTIGFDWEFKDFTTQTGKDGTIVYTATGVLDWKILGIPFYSQTKDIIGNFKIE